MLKLKEKPQPGNVSYLPRPELESTHRLFVLVPSTEADPTLLIRRIWELASAGASHVQFIGLCSDPDRELATRRVLVSMASMMNFGSVTSELQVMPGKNWVDNLTSRLHRGDTVVYWDAEVVSPLHSPLRQLLHANLQVPLYIVPGKSAPQQARAVSSRQVMAWIGFIAILLGFLFLQIKIYQLATSWTTVLALLSTAAEFWLIWVWHNWFK